MADVQMCTCITRGPPSDPWAKPCDRAATHRLVDKDGEGFLCGYHARAIRDMYEPGQLRKIRARQQPRNEHEGKATK